MTHSVRGDWGCKLNTRKLTEGHTCWCEHEGSNSRAHCVFICFTEMFSRQRDTHIEGGVHILASCIHVTAQLMAQITCEAAADSHSKSGSLVFACVCQFIVSWLYIWMGTHTFLCHLSIHGKQRAICVILLGVEPCVTTDLYIGPVAMAPGVADAEMGWRP